MRAGETGEKKRESYKCARAYIENKKLYHDKDLNALHIETHLL